MKFSFTDETVCTPHYGKNLNGTVHDIELAAEMFNTLLKNAGAQYIA